MTCEVVFCKEQSLLSALLATCSPSTEAPDTGGYWRAQGFVLCGIYSNSSLLRLLRCIRPLPRSWRHLLSGFNDIFSQHPCMQPYAWSPPLCSPLSPWPVLLKWNHLLVKATLSTLREVLWVCRCLGGCLLWPCISLSIYIYIFHYRFGVLFLSFSEWKVSKVLPSLLFL